MAVEESNVRIAHYPQKAQIVGLLWKDYVHKYLSWLTLTVVSFCSLLYGVLIINTPPIVEITQSKGNQLYISIKRDDCLRLIIIVHLPASFQLSSILTKPRNGFELNGQINQHLSLLDSGTQTCPSPQPNVAVDGLFVPDTKHLHRFLHNKEVASKLETCVVNPNQLEASVNELNEETKRKEENGSDILIPTCNTEAQVIIEKSDIEKTEKIAAITNQEVDLINTKSKCNASHHKRDANPTGKAVDITHKEENDNDVKFEDSANIDQGNHFTKQVKFNDRARGDSGNSEKNIHLKNQEENYRNRNTTGDSDTQDNLKNVPQRNDPIKQEFNRNEDTKSIKSYGNTRISHSLPKPLDYNEGIYVRPIKDSTKQKDSGNPWKRDDLSKPKQTNIAKLYLEDDLRTLTEAFWMGYNLARPVGANQKARHIANDNEKEYSGNTMKKNDFTKHAIEITEYVIAPIQELDYGENDHKGKKKNTLRVIKMEITEILNYNVLDNMQMTDDGSFNRFYQEISTYLNNQMNCKYDLAKCLQITISDDMTFEAKTDIGLCQEEVHNEYRYHICGSKIQELQDKNTQSTVLKETLSTAQYPINISCSSGTNKERSIASVDPPRKTVYEYVYISEMRRMRTVFQRSRVAQRSSLYDQIRKQMMIFFVSKEYAPRPIIYWRVLHPLVEDTVRYLDKKE